MTMDEAMPAMDRLRSATRGEHDELEALPYFAALATGVLSRAAYATLIEALRILHQTVEGELIPAAGDTVAPVWDEAMRAVPALERDLAYLAAPVAQHIPPALTRAAALADEIRDRAAAAPSAVLGVLYVLEGSALGGVLLRHQVARALSLPAGEAQSYLARYGGRTGSRWERFRGRMNATLVTAAAQDQAIAAARMTYRGLIEVVDALGPGSPAGVQPPLAQLNPEAGRHAIADDVRELQAALRAGGRSWREFPYLGWRYGDRGRRFTRSDSAWIVTLVRERQPVVLAQVRWLGRLLAARGMPQWLLESHLRALQAELTAALPDRRQRYQRLLAAAEMLAEMRRARIDDETLASLAHSFDAEVGETWRRRLPEAGVLLVAAVADERAGVRGAVTSIEPWMTDADRFPAEWRAAVHRTIGEARALAS